MEPVGVSKVGETTTSEIFVNTANMEAISAVLVGGSAVTYTKGTALKNGTTAGTKVKYTNADVSPTGLCILLENAATTVAGGNVITTALVAGTVNLDKIKDAAGAAVDAAFKAALNNVRFS